MHGGACEYTHLYAPNRCAELYNKTGCWPGTQCILVSNGLKQLKRRTRCEGGGGASAPNDAGAV